MLEPAAMNAEFRDIEEMVRAAGDYLEVGDDLRADTLEEARSVRRQTSTRHWISALAVALVFLAMSVGHLRSRLAGISTVSDQFYAAALQNAAQANADPNWALVEMFSGIRQHQASLIDDAF